MQVRDKLLLKSVLIDMFGLPKNVACSSEDATAVVSMPKASCMLACDEDLPGDKLYQHFLDEIAEQKEIDSKDMECNKLVNCIVCRTAINYIDNPNEYQKHYQEHLPDLKMYIYNSVSLIHNPCYVPTSFNVVCRLALKSMLRSLS